jgi:SPP1 gp7 family putative phage head morphogenesis protein
LIFLVHMPINDLPSVDELWDDDEERRDFKRTMLPFLLLGFLSGAENTATKTDPNHLLTPWKRVELDSKSLVYAAATIRTTKKALAEEIDQAVQNGESVKQLASRIDDLFGSQMAYRSTRIARTQLTETINDGTLSALVTEGARFKQWSTVIDGRERPSHHAANGQTVGINEPFRLDDGSAGMYPGADTLPVSQTANCRCVCVAADAPDTRKKVLGDLFLRTHGSLERKYVISLRRAFRAQRDRIISRLPS